MNVSEDWYADYLKRTGKAAPEPEKKQKYRNNRVTVDGICFDSQLEADKYCELKLAHRAGLIAGFCLQPEFVLIEGTGEMRPEIYRADFIVFNLDGTYEIIDTKGYETEVFRIKHKQFMTKFPLNRGGSRGD
jgi:hypothetical protein